MEKHRQDEIAGISWKASGCGISLFSGHMRVACGNLGTCSDVCIYIYTRNVHIYIWTYLGTYIYILKFRLRGTFHSWKNPVDFHEIEVEGPRLRVKGVGIRAYPRD